MKERATVTVAHLAFLTLTVLALPAHAGEALAPYASWAHSGSLYLLTTPEGANLPASASEDGFPVLVRLHKDFFDFSQAKAQGEDLRFSSSSGTPLPYQVEEWDAANGTASIWVRIPTLKGNARQEIKMHWGKNDAASESNGAAVFSAENGFVSVIHLDEALKDELGAVTPKDQGTTKATGLIGHGRHFTKGKGIDCGKKITTYPFSDSPFTSEAWFRAEPEAAGSMILYWGRYATRFNGKTGDGNEVGIGIDSPPRLGWGSDGPGGARTETPLRLRQWTHVAATYGEGNSRLYVNGSLAGSNFHKAAMSIVKDICMNIGGWRGSNYGFAGDIDEVRVSRVARSADWMKLEYENQNAQQTLVGPLVQTGSDFSVSEKTLTVLEGKSATVTAKAGGAQKIYWLLKRDGAESIVSVDRFAFTLEAGRVTADTALTIQLKAVYPNEVKTIEIPVTIKEEIPEPVVALKAPTAWDGRATIEVSTEVANQDAMQAKGAGELKYHWTVSNIAVIKELAPGKLILKRAQNSGKMTVTLAINNGGAPVTATTAIQVTEPKKDVWVQRTPAKDEKPEENQFYARDDQNEGSLFYNGTLDQAAESVFLKLYADDKRIKTETQKPGADKSYAFTVKLKPGLVRYKVEFGTKSGETETVLKSVGNLICGDAYIIDGQSNAEATGPNNGPAMDPPTPHNDWIRSYGNQLTGSLKGGWGTAVRTRIWGKPDYGFCQIGAWGMVLAERLVATYKIPVCIINGSFGGTRIDQHQPNPANRRDTSGENPYANPHKIYGCLLTRIEAARLTHGIRGVLWHQGENNQGSASPTGDYDWKSYQQYFVDMAAAWKEDYPNIQHYYIWQIWPSGCNMGGTPAGDMLLEVQRTLPSLFSNMRIMSTLGIVSKSSGRGLAHFDLEGYAQVAQLMSPLVEQDNYGFVPPQAMTAPNLKRAWFTSAAKNEIALDFGQPMAWKDGCDAWFNLDDKKAPISTGKVEGNVITLQLKAATEAKTISYLSGRDWDGRPNRLLYGANGIAALALSTVPIEAPAK